MLSGTYLKSKIREASLRKQQRGTSLRLSGGGAFPAEGMAVQRPWGALTWCFQAQPGGQCGRRGEGRGIRAARRGRVRQAPGHCRGLAFYSVRRDWQRALTRGLMGTHVFISATVGAVELTSLTGVGLDRPSVLWLRPGLPVWLPTRPLLAPAWLGGPGTALPGPLICGLSHVHPPSPSLALYEPHYTLA